MTFPSPPSLGLGNLHWRPEQDAALWDAIESSTRFIGVDAPTGFGKTHYAQGLAKALGGRWAYLTGTKQLMDQISRDFPYSLDVRGQSNYKCKLDERVMVIDGPCHAGVQCDWKKNGCLYYDKIRAAQSWEAVHTNYALWLTSYRYAEGLGTFDGLICDEGHSAAEWIVGTAGVEWTREDVKATEAMPPERGWARWAATLSIRLQLEQAGVELGSRRARVLRDLIRKLSRFPEEKLEGQWARVPSPESVLIQPLWPRGAGDREWLFQRIKKVVLVSATLRERDLDLLQIGAGERSFFEYGSSFASRNRPIWYVPTIKVTANSGESDKRKWAARVDEWIEEWKEHKGIIHTVSYQWQVEILKRTRFRGIMIAPGKGENFERALARFIASRAPSVLVTPRAREGVDLPDDLARWALVAKLPFPNSLDPIAQARAKDDKEYALHLTAKELIQMTGRIVRNSGDWGVTGLIDDNWKWFQHAARPFLAKWWKSAVRYSTTVPKVRRG
jgi:Rad3-related DNA helicase